MRRREFVAGVLLAAALPPARAQQRQPAPVIGYLSGGAPGFSAPYVAAFREGISERGFVEGQNVATQYRWAEGRYAVLLLCIQLKQLSMGILLVLCFSIGLREGMLTPNLSLKVDYLFADLEREHHSAPALVTGTPAILALVPSGTSVRRPTNHLIRQKH